MSSFIVFVCVRVVKILSTRVTISGAPQRFVVCSSNPARHCYFIHGEHDVMRAGKGLTAGVAATVVNVFCSGFGVT